MSRLLTEDIVGLGEEVTLKSSENPKVLRMQFPIGVGKYQILVKICTTIIDKEFVYVSPLLVLTEQFNEIISRHAVLPNISSQAYSHFCRTLADKANMENTVLILDEHHYQNMKVDIDALSSRYHQIILLQ